MWNIIFFYFLFLSVKEKIFFNGVNFFGKLMFWKCRKWYLNVHKSRNIYIKKTLFWTFREQNYRIFFSPKIKVSENFKLDFWNLLKPQKNILKGQIKIMIFSSKKCQVKVINILKNQKISQPYKSFDKIWKYIWT